MGSLRASRLRTIWVALSFVRLASSLRCFFDSVIFSFALSPLKIRNDFDPSFCLPSLSVSVPTQASVASAGHVSVRFTTPLGPTFTVARFSAIPAYGTGGFPSTRGLAADVFAAQPAPSGPATPPRKLCPASAEAGGDAVSWGPVAAGQART